jgi:hypothetical protein
MAQRIMTKQKKIKRYQNEGSLGLQVFLSFLKNLANSKASSLIKVSNVCFLPYLILGISTHSQKSV